MVIKCPKLLFVTLLNDKGVLLQSVVVVVGYHTCATGKD